MPQLQRALRTFAAHRPTRDEDSSDRSKNCCFKTKAAEAFPTAFSFLVVGYSTDLSARWLA